MQRLLLLLAGLLLISIAGCGNSGDALVGSDSQDQLQNDTDKTSSGDQLILDEGDPWDDEHGPDGGTGGGPPEEEHGQGTGGGGDKPPPYDPNEPPSEDP